MEKLLVVKIGGNIIDDEKKLAAFLKSFAALEQKKILVHGGGKLATRVAEAMGIPQQMAEGRRITDAETLKVITMVYAGYINKNIVALLQAENVSAIGLSGADGGLIRAHKRVKGETDYGFAGDIDEVDQSLLTDLLDRNLTVVLCPVTHDGKGQLLNTNADTIAASVAGSLSANFDTQLVFCFEKKGVLQNTADEYSVIDRITPKTYSALQVSGIISEGMIPKLNNAFDACKNGVQEVRVGAAEDLEKLVNHVTGTAILKDE